VVGDGPVTQKNAGLVTPLIWSTRAASSSDVPANLTTVPSSLRVQLEKAITSGSMSIR